MTKINMSLVATTSHTALHYAYVKTGVICSCFCYDLGMDPQQINNDNGIPPAEETTVPAINQPVISQEEPQKNRKWKSILLVALIIVGIPLIGYLLLFIAFSGGIDRALTELKSAPDPKSSSVTAKRDTTIKDIENEFRQIEGSTNLTRHTRSTYDYCSKGQNNSKVNEGFAHRCDYQATHYYGFNGDFRTTMLEFEKEITANGWQAASDQSSISGIINNYYDRYYGNKDLKVSKNFGGNYLVSDMPNVNGYTRNNMFMSITYAERSKQDLGSLESAQGHSVHGLLPLYEDKDFNDIEAVFNDITSNNTYILAITLGKNYFKN